jgi:hypothetical protein
MSEADTKRTDKSASGRAARSHGLEQNSVTGRGISRLLRGSVTHAEHNNGAQDSGGAKDGGYAKESKSGGAKVAGVEGGRNECSPG